MIAKHFAYVPIAFAAVCALQGAPAANMTTAANPAIANYARPVSFEPNRGQTGKQVDFLAHGTGYSLFLSHAEAVMVLKSGAAVRMRPVGANASISAAPLDEQTSKSNYFIGNVPERWRTDIPNYSKVRYANVYPGVDLIYYGNQRQLEYDFVVKPGADVGAVGLQFDGPAQPLLERSGDLIMHTDSGDLRWCKPVAYQEINGGRKLIACAYTRSNAGSLRFAVGTYDHSQPLIIDPVLEYSTYLGGSGDGLFGGDIGNAIAVDAHGDAYITGSTISDNFPTKNAFQNTNLDGSMEGDLGVAFVTKFDTLGNLVYSTFLGGGGNFIEGVGDSGNGIAVDAAGHAYVTGSTGSGDFPTKNAFQNSLSVREGAFVTKLGTTGDALVYSTYLSGIRDEFCDIFCDTSGNGIAVDSHGFAYVTGFTQSDSFPLKNPFQSQLKFPGLSSDAFVTKLSAAGNTLIYSTYLGGSGNVDVTFGDIGNGIAVDAHGSAYVTGSTSSKDFPTKNPFQKQLNAKGGVNAFVTKFDAAGSALVYSTYLGGSGKFCYPNSSVCVGDSANGIAVDAHGQAYITGLAYSHNFPIKNAFQSHNNGKCTECTNAFVTKFNEAGTALVYSTYLGGSGNVANQTGDLGAGVVVDREDQVYITGTTNSVNFPTKDAFQKTYAGGQDAFVTKLCIDGTLVYSSYLGGSGLDGAIDFVGPAPHGGIGVDLEGNVYVTGSTSSANFPTKNAFQPMLANTGQGTNAFVTKISAK